MLDAGSKLVSGVLDGHFQDLGNYEQCINVREPNFDFQGQHCVVKTWGVLPTQVGSLKFVLKFNFIIAHERLKTASSEIANVLLTLL